MSKKDYQTIAACIFLTKQPGSKYWNPGVLSDCGKDDAFRAGFDAALALVTSALSLEMSLENPRFSEDRFREACETGKCRGMRQAS